ncbi:MAG: lipopolysaccharide biosynthesis protein [Rhizobiales bacterium]|nr:lipopolysaccharide biosynthesis protein [Hyphomicrobiales bacterium]
MSLWRMILTAVNLIGVRFGGAGLGLLSQIVLARLLPQADVGVIFLGMSAAAIVSQVVTVGYPPLAMTCLPRYYALGRINLVRAFHAAFWRDSFVIIAVVAALTAIVVLATPLDPGLKTAIIFGCLSAPASSLIRINSATANSLRRFSLSYVPDFIYRPGLLLAYLLLAWWLGLGLSVTSVLWAFIIANSMVALGQAWLMGRQGAIPPPFRTVRRNLAPLLRGRAGSLVIVAVVATSFADLVNLIGGFFLPPDDVAVLGVCIRLAALVGFITQATQNFILPDLAAALTRGNRSEVQSLLLRINAVALAAMAACIGGAVVAGHLVLRIFGSQYEVGYWPLVLFMVSQGFRAASGMNQHLLSIDGHQSKTASSCLFAVSALVLAASILTPRYGVMGMAIAVIIADAIWAALLAFQAQRHTGRRGDIVALLRASP